MKRMLAFDDSLKSGLSFGLASGVITTIGLIIGLYFGTNSKEIVLAGILTIAFADALSDAFGMHLAVESRKNSHSQDVLKSAISTFVAKLFFALTFAIPIILLEITLAVFICVIWGALLLTGASIFIAQQNNENEFKIIAEHLIIAGVAVLVSYAIGVLLSGII